MIRVIPMRNLPRFEQTVRIDGVLYVFRFAWNVIGRHWTIDLLTSDNEPIIVGEKMTLNFPLFFGSVDPRLPEGVFFVIDPSNRQTSEPGRTAWSDDGESLRFVYVRAV